MKLEFRELNSGRMSLPHPYDSDKQIVFSATTIAMAEVGNLTELKAYECNILA